MQQWDYLTVMLGSVDGFNLAPRWLNGQELQDWKKVDLPTFLSQVGQEGWEMVGTLAVSRANYATLFFKRPRAS